MGSDRGIEVFGNEYTNENENVWSTKEKWNSECGDSQDYCRNLLFQMSRLTKTLWELRQIWGNTKNRLKGQRVQKHTCMYEDLAYDTKEAQV